MPQRSGAPYVGAGGGRADKGRLRPMTGFGALVRRCRLAAGLTQQELADATTLGVRTVRNIERGAVVPYQRTVEVLAAGLRLGGTERERLLAVARAGRSAAAGQLAGELPGHQPLPWSVVDRRRSLPAQSPGFVGRHAERDLLDSLAEAAVGGRLRGAVVLVTGLPGVGKSALLRQAAHQLHGRFGTVLSQDLRGTAAVLAGVDLHAAEDLLESLTDAGLLGPGARAGWYEVHDLIRLFAADRAVAEDSPSERSGDLDRIRSWLRSRVQRPRSAVAAAPLGVPGAR